MMDQRVARGVTQNPNGLADAYNASGALLDAKVCCVCLSWERRLTALGVLRSTYEMLMRDFIFEDSTFGSKPRSVCWECSALLRRISLFKQRAHAAQLTLRTAASAAEADQETKHPAALTWLTVILKGSYDFTFEHSDADSPGPKLERLKTEDEFPFLEVDGVDPKSEPDEFNSDEMVPLTALIEDRRPDEDRAARKRRKLSKRDRRIKESEKAKLKGEKKTEWSCRDCGQLFVTRGKMTYHQRTVHADPVLCNECGRVFSFKPTLEKHMLTHFGGIPQYPCHLCGKSFAGRGGIKSHMIHVHQASRETFRCELCDLTFKTKYKYKSHVKWSKRHGGQGTEKHECEKCNRRYKTKQRLFEHFSFQHLGKAAHKCTICEKEISSLLGLKKHIKYVHEGQEKPRTHVCETCGDAFKQVSMLRQHQYIHTGEKPYSCDVCGALFRQKGSLYTHRRLVHLKIKRNSGKAAGNTT